jgi:hypothetical protein
MITPEQIAEWRKLEPEGMVSAVGEYTPEEFWLALDHIEVLQARIAQLEAELAAAREALTPSGSTKAAYHGEFAFNLFRGVSDAGIDQHEKVYVPWDTVKEIMAAIAHRALKDHPHDV